MILLKKLKYDINQKNKNNYGKKNYFCKKKLNNFSEKK